MGAGHLEAGVGCKYPGERIEIAALTRGIGVMQGAFDVVAAVHAVLPPT
jgi:hypothetical protein